MLTLSKLINLSNLEVAPVSELPETLFPDVTDSLPVKIAVYGELLVYEARILESLQGKVSSHLNRFFKLFTLLNYVPQGLEAVTSLITELQLGHVTRVTEATVDYDPVFWRSEEVDALAANGATLENDGFNQLLEDNYITWAEATGVYIPAQLLSVAIGKQAYTVNITEKVEIDAEQLLTDCNLTWSDLYCYQDLLTPDLDLCILLALRTGIWNYNVLDSLTVSQADRLREVLRKEIGPKDTTPIVHNQNVEQSEGKETSALETSEDTSESTNPQAKRSRKKEPAKKP